MKSDSRVGVVGTSWWADAMHLPSTTSHSGARLAAICGRDRARADEMAAKFGADTVWTDWRAMIASGLLDAVVISTPDELHAPIAIAAAEAGLHVLCEKPLARSVADAEAMCAAAERAGVVAMVYFTYRWNPWFRFLKELRDENRVGNIRRTHAHFFSASNRVRAAAHPAVAPWRYDPRRASGALGDLGSHVIDLAHWLVGGIRDVTTELETRFPLTIEGAPDLHSANDTARLAVVFESGATGTLAASSAEDIGKRGLEIRVELEGDRGMLVLDYGLDKAELFFVAAASGISESLGLPDRFAEGLEGLSHAERMHQVFSRQNAGCRAFIDAILAETPAAPSFRDGLAVQRILEKAEAPTTGRV